jgi:hypothetical protein
MAVAAGDDYPVRVEQDGIKLKTEKMVIDQLYHCIYESKVFLFTRTSRTCSTATKWKARTL